MQEMGKVVEKGGPGERLEHLFNDYYMSDKD